MNELEDIYIYISPINGIEKSYGSKFYSNSFYTINNCIKFSYSQSQVFAKYHQNFDY